MTAEETGASQAILVATSVVLLANLLIGYARPGSWTRWVALLQASTGTVLLLAGQLTSGTPDGQAGIAVPMFLLIFFFAAWAGLAAGEWLGRRAKPISGHRRDRLREPVDGPRP